MRTISLIAFVALMSGAAFGQTQTAQSAMASLTLGSNAYQIDGQITWTFQKATAETYYTPAAGVWDGNAPFCDGSAANCASSNKPATPSAPATPLTGPNSVANHAQDDRCVFWSGGNLPDWNYTQTATVNGLNGKGNWTFTFNYSTTGQDGLLPKTAWSSEVTGGSVAVGFTGFVTSESFLKQSARNKYSFTMLDSGVTRARNVSASLSGPAAASLDLNNVDTDVDTINDGLAVVSASNNFSYYGNGGVFGNSAVFGALHAEGRKPANLVTNILNGELDGTNADNFAGNNNDLSAGNVQIAPFSGSFSGLTLPGGYTITVSGSLKGNSSTADFGFNVASNIITIGGCTP